jgi:hypothetical protein
VNTPPQVIPLQLDIADTELDDDFETLDQTPEPGLVGKAMAVLKSPIGIGVVAILIIALGAGAMLANGSLQMIGKPQSNHDGALAGDAGVVSEELVAQPKLEGEREDDETVAEEEKEEEDPFSSEYGTVTFSGNGAVYHTVPTTVALNVSGQSRKLTLSVGILTDAKSADVLLSEGLAVNLLKIEVAESLELGPYLDWQIPGLVSKNLKRRLEVAFPELNVRGIMIRDFSLASR